MSKMLEIEADTKVAAYLAEPEGEAKGAVIVIHEVWGLNDHTKSVADRVAAEGYYALAPGLIDFEEMKHHDLNQLQKDLFNPETRNEVQPQLRKIMAPMQAPDFGRLTTERLKACFEYVKALENVNGRLAVMGFCFGGTYSFNLAVEEPELKLALPFYGHADQPVEELKKIKCPVRLYLGEKDERLMDQLPDLEKRMKEANVDFAVKVYPNCGHAFFNDTNPYAYNEAAAKDAWEQVKNELKSHL